MELVVLVSIFTSKVLQYHTNTIHKSQAMDFRNGFVGLCYNSNYVRLLEVKNKSILTILI